MKKIINFIRHTSLWQILFIWIVFILLINISSLIFKEEKTLSMSNCEVNLTQLEVDELNKVFNKSRTIENWCFQYDIEAEWLSKIPSWIFKLNNLEALYFSSWSISVISEDIWLLTNLTYLDLSDNNLTSIPDNISNLKKLTNLDLSKNNLDSISSWIFKLSNLEVLSLSDNKLTSVSSDIWKLVNLKDLSLYNNKIETLVKEIWNLINLTDLYLYNMDLKSLPVEISNLKNLSFLGLSWNTALDPLDKNYSWSNTNSSNNFKKWNMRIRFNSSSYKVEITLE